MDMLASGKITFPLSAASVGARVRIVGFRSGRETERKLVDLGLYVGSEVTVLSRGQNGPLLVARDGIRLGIDAGVARRITVAQVGEP